MTRDGRERTVAVLAAALARPGRAPRHAVLVGHMDDARVLASGTGLGEAHEGLWRERADVWLEQVEERRGRRRGGGRCVRVEQDEREERGRVGDEVDRGREGLDGGDGQDVAEGDEGRAERHLEGGRQLRGRLAGGEDAGEQAGRGLERGERRGRDEGHGRVGWKGEGGSKRAGWGCSRGRDGGGRAGGKEGRDGGRRRQLARSAQAGPPRPGRRPAHERRSYNALSTTCQATESSHFQIVHRNRRGSLRRGSRRQTARGSSSSSRPRPAARAAGRPSSSLLLLLLRRAAGRRSPLRRPRTQPRASRARPSGSRARGGRSRHTCSRPWARARTTGQRPASGSRAQSGPGRCTGCEADGGSERRQAGVRENEGETRHALALNAEGGATRARVDHAPGEAAAEADCRPAKASSALLRARARDLAGPRGEGRGMGGKRGLARRDEVGEPGTHVTREAARLQRSKMAVRQRHGSSSSRPQRVEEQADGEGRERRT